MRCVVCFSSLLINLVPPFLGVEHTCALRSCLSVCACVL